jgi:hypothetical protein
MVSIGHDNCLHRSELDDGLVVSAGPEAGPLNAAVSTTHHELDSVIQEMADDPDGTSLTCSNAPINSFFKTRSCAPVSPDLGTRRAGSVDRSGQGSGEERCRGCPVHGQSAVVRTAR